MEVESVELKAPSEKGPELVSESANEEVDFSSIIDYFGMDRPNLEEKNDLRDLFNLLEGGRKSRGDLLNELRQLEIRFGSPPTGENRMKRLINILKLDKDIEELHKQQRAYIRS